MGEGILSILKADVRNWYMEGRQALCIGGITQHNRSVKNRAQKMAMGKPVSEKHGDRS